jgi:AcrR family transcriptional regulator
MSKLKPDLKRGEQTRLRILTEAASLFHHNGYASTGLDELLERTGVTKGAFYHHFRSKKEVALAVIDEIVADQLRRRMIDPVINAPEPLVAIRKAISRLRKEVPTEELLTGCPVNNLASELALQDKDFQSALGTLFNEWERAWTEALRHELESGRAHNYKDPREFSLYLITLIEGAQALAKAQQSRKPLDAALKRLDSILATA